MADRLGISLQRCLDETPSSDFAGWLAYIEQSQNDHEKQDYYMAQLAAVMANAFRGKGSAPQKPNNFLLKFRVRDFTSREERMAKSKAFWSRATKKQPTAKE